MCAKTKIGGAQFANMLYHDLALCRVSSINTIDGNSKDYMRLKTYSVNFVYQ